MEVIVTISVSPLLSAIPCIRLIQFRKKCGLICSCANSSSICFSLSSFSCQSHILSPSIFRRFLYAKQRRIYCHYTTDSAHRGSFFIPLYIVFYSPRIAASISSKYSKPYFYLIPIVKSNAYLPLNFFFAKLIFLCQSRTT